MKPPTKNELRLPFNCPKTASVFNTELTGKWLQRKSLPLITCNPLLFRFCLILKSIFSSTNTVKDFREVVLVFKLLDFIYSPYFLKFSHSRVCFIHRIERRVASLSFIKRIQNEASSLNAGVNRAVARVKKGGSRATRVIENGQFSFLGCDPGRDFLTRADPG